jgi:aspartyl-tRNA(Asn)/glutamyl-tRNA(Gln) amidotransferase subunit C
MKITPETVRELCDLARLPLDPDEAERMRSDLERILHYVEKLSELETEGVSPTSHVIEIATPMRADEVRGVLPVEDAVRNAPQEAGGSFVVPKVIE